MKKHPSDQQLLDFEFKLLEAAAHEEVGAHLGECEICRQRLEALAGKLAQLELVRDEMPVPAEILDRVTAMAADRTASPTPVATWGKWPRALLAAAAVLFLALPLILMRQPIGQIDGDEDLGEPFAPGSNIELNVLPRREKVQLTIYNSADLTLVRERRTLTMKQGWNWLQFMWANTLIDPTSLALRPQGVGDKVEVQQLVFPPRLKGVGRWLLRSEISGPVECEITYLTSGIAWRAFYMGTLARDERTMRLEGYVRADNRSGEDYEKAQVRLLVGKVNLLDQIASLARRQHPYGRPIPGRWGWQGGAFAKGRTEYFREEAPDEESDGAGNSYAFKQIKKEGLSEYFLYTIEGTETIPHGWGKRLPSSAVDGIPVVNLYKYDEERWKGVIRFLSFANDKEHKLGETPIPNGMVRIFAKARGLPANAAPEDGYLAYVGGTSVKYIPVEEEVELSLGAARRVMVEPALLATKTENFRYDKFGNIVGWDEVQSWQIEVRNARNLPVKLEITRAAGTSYWRMDRVDKDFGFVRHDATHARFTFAVPPHAKPAFSYELRTFHGKRQEEMKQ